MAAASWIPLAAVSSARAPTARPSVSERRSRRSSGAVLWETPRASNSDTRRRLLRFASGGSFALLGDGGDLAQVALDSLQFRRHDRDVDDEEDHEDDVGAG